MAAYSSRYWSFLQCHYSPPYLRAFKLAPYLPLVSGWCVVLCLALLEDNSYSRIYSNQRLQGIVTTFLHSPSSSSIPNKWRSSASVFSGSDGTSYDLLFSHRMASLVLGEAHNSRRASVVHIFA